MPFISTVLVRALLSRKSENAILSGRSVWEPIAEKRKCNFIWARPDAILSGLTSPPIARKAKMQFIWASPDAISSGLADAIYVDRYCSFPKPGSAWPEHFSWEAGLVLSKPGLFFQARPSLPKPAGL